MLVHVKGKVKALQKKRTSPKGFHAYYTHLYVFSELTLALVGALRRMLRHGGCENL